MDGLSVGLQCFRSPEAAAAAYCASVSGVSSAGVISCRAPSIVNGVVSYTLTTQTSAAASSASDAHPPHCGDAWDKLRADGSVAARQNLGSPAEVCGNLGSQWTAGGWTVTSCTTTEFAGRIDVRSPDGQSTTFERFVRANCTPESTAAAQVSMELMPCVPQDIQTHGPAIAAWVLACATIVAARMVYTRIFKGES